MQAGDDDLIHFIHTIWSAALTALGGIVWWSFRWNWNRLCELVDKKADKDEVDSFKEEIRSWKEEQQSQHRENRQRLDAILSNTKRSR
jgi:Mg2+/Co2+ transporter CorB